MILKQILQSTIIDGGTKEPEFPDLSMLMTILQHNSYASEDDCESDGNTPAKWKVEIRVSYERIS